jgi:hypothetical protein
MNEETQKEIPKMLRTSEAAKALHRSKQTLRLWASKCSGPIQPVRLNGYRGPLLWRESDIIALLSSGKHEKCDG